MNVEKKNEVRRSRGLPEKKIYRKSLLEDYSHVGKRNFISYALRASDIMDSKKIKRQVQRLHKLLLTEIES